MAKTAEGKKQTGEPLLRPATVRLLAAVALAVMALAVVVDVLHGHAGHFGFDVFPAFYALLGIVSGFLIIGIAKGLGRPLSRPDTYYGDDEREADE